MKYLGMIMVAVLFFFAGSFWQKWQLLESGAVELTKPLVLQSRPEALGQLPAGTVLYPYSRSGSIETFVVFVNTKNLDLLKPHTFEHSLTVSPIDGYAE